MDELEKIIKNKENLELYFDKYKNNSFFLYHYYINDFERIKKNFYIQESFINTNDKFNLIYYLLENNGKIEDLNIIMNNFGAIYDSTKEKEIFDLFKHMIILEKEGKISLDNFIYKNRAYFMVDPLYAIEKDVSNIENIIGRFDSNTLIRILKICNLKNYVFTNNNIGFIKNYIYGDLEVFRYFLQNCKVNFVIEDDIRNYLKKIDIEKLYSLYEFLPETYKNHALDRLNNNNYNFKNIIKDKDIYLNIDGHEDDILNLLKEIKNSNCKANIFLEMSRIKMDFIDKAYEILGNQIKIVPSMNQEIIKGSNRYESYSVDDIKKKDEILNLYASSTRDTKDKNGNIKSLSPFEKFIAAYIITTKFAKYKEEKDRLTDYHVSRSVYDLLGLDGPIDIVCVGYVNLLKELLYRMGIYDTMDWNVRCKNTSGYDRGCNHRRMIIHLYDEKYDIDGVYMSDPTFDSISYNLNSNKIKHMLMTEDELLKIDSHKFNSYNDIFYDNSVNYIEKAFNISDIHKLFNKKISEEKIVKAFLAVHRFLDKNMTMAKENNISPNGYSEEEYDEEEKRLGFINSRYDVPTPNEEINKPYSEMLSDFKKYQGLSLSTNIELNKKFREYIKDKNIKLSFDLFTYGLSVDVSSLSDDLIDSLSVVYQDNLDIDDKRIRISIIDKNISYVDSFSYLLSGLNELEKNIKKIDVERKKGK